MSSFQCRDFAVFSPNVVCSISCVSAGSLGTPTCGPATASELRARRLRLPRRSCRLSGSNLQHVVVLPVRQGALGVSDTAHVEGGSLLVVRRLRSCPPGIREESNLCVRFHEHEVTESMRPPRFSLCPRMCQCRTSAADFASRILPVRVHR